MVENDLFKQINDAVLDLQSSQLQSFSRPLKRLAQLLQHSDLTSTNDVLTRDVSLDGFLKESEKTQGSMVGSAQLLWPDSQEHVMGLTLLLIQKFAANPDDMVQFGFTYFYTNNHIISAIHNVTGQLIIPFIRDYKAYILARGNTKAKIVMPLSTKIFIVHGHDEGARESVARFLQTLGFEPIILHEQANRGRTVIEKVEANSDVSFAVVLLTPDDEGCTKGGALEPRARQNVLLELGYFLGRLGRERVCALKRGDVEIPSDFAGVVWEALDAGGAWKRRLGQELQAIGHVIDWNKVMA
ncbi:hypothetical protein GJ689_21530 [Rhodoplanes serenus]|uniref:CD-NTase-associated protein 12/Pycsar effector protein TIR domain-containing protein n=1 Tax=Rhodoplanes serenus TaxID=200615 RepID=A0A9X4XR69_9BRAD|nr:nucleotide-binding protein [Rhodoplanes serenus]MTW18786.1 hypothetical protein [Rhodoplanes serenus]